MSNYSLSFIALFYLSQRFLNKGFGQLLGSKFWEVNSIQASQVSRRGVGGREEGAHERRSKRKKARSPGDSPLPRPGETYHSHRV